MKQKEGAPFHRFLVDHSLHYPPETKASKTYSQQFLSPTYGMMGLQMVLASLGGSPVPLKCTLPSRAFPMAAEHLLFLPQVGFARAVGAGQLQPHPSCLPGALMEVCQG